LADGPIGALGFPLPRIAVLVNSIHESPNPDVNELETFLSLSGAVNGLFVAWWSFSEQAKREAGRLFHHAEFWDLTHIVDALKVNYDKMPSELKSYLPLKRIWILDQRSDADFNTPTKASQSVSTARMCDFSIGDFSLLRSLLSESTALIYAP
jgi:hypothetical protein